jgi:uncharacterized RDD family membrane protein YckC
VISCPSVVVKGAYLVDGAVVRPATTTSRTAPVKTCPFCAEQVQDAAKVCKHCHRSIVEEASAPPFAANSHLAAVLQDPRASLYPKAPFGARFLAWILDCLVVGVPVALATGFILLAFLAGPLVGVPIAILVGLPVAVWALYYQFTKDGRGNGQSVGKKSMGLMVVHLQTNNPCSRGQSALRALVQCGLNLIPYLGWLIEPGVTVAAAGGRRLGDHAAGTQVIPVASYHR